MKIKTLVSGKLDNNTYIVCNDDATECFLVDAAADLEDIKPRVDEMKVLGIILTHGHYDHFVNLDKIMDYYNVKCYMTETDLEKLYNPKWNYSIVFNQIKTSKQPKENFVLLGENDSFSLGSFDIKTFVTKGHTDGSICIEVEKVLFTGDTKFCWSTGRTDLISGSEEDMQKSLEYLEKKYKGTTFYPGHGKPGVI